MAFDTLPVIACQWRLALSTSVSVQLVKIFPMEQIFDRAVSVGWKVSTRDDGGHEGLILDPQLRAARSIT